MSKFSHIFVNFKKMQKIKKICGSTAKKLYLKFLLHRVVSIFNVRLFETSIKILKN